MVFLIFFAVLSVVVMRRQMPDDAYIYLRMAQNIVGRGEWAFNPGIPVNAATSPLYGVLVALLVALHLPGLATPLMLASAIGLIGLAIAVYRGTAYLGWGAAFLMAITSISFATLLHSEGLETPVYLACVGLTALFVQGGNEYALGAAAGLTAIGRPEGSIMIVLALGTQWWRAKRVPWGGLLLALLPITLWLLYSQHTFHTVVPHTMKIKAMQSAVLLWHGSWLLEFLEQLRPLLLLSPFAVAGGVLAFREYRRRPFLPLILTFGVAQTAGYTFLHAPAKYFWYDAPGDLAFILAALLGLLAALRWVVQRMYLDPHRATVLALAGVTVVYLINCAFWERENSVSYRVSPDYIATGRWLHDHARPGDWVAADEIGYLGVYSGLPVRDMLGLADPRSVAALQHHRWDFWFTDSPKPRYIVGQNPVWVGEPGFQDTPWQRSALGEYAKDYHPVFRAGRVKLMQLN